MVTGEIEKMMYYTLGYTMGSLLPWVPETFLARFPVSVKSL